MLYLASGGEEALPAVSGTIDRVGKDFLEIAAVPFGEARRPANVRGVYAVPFAAVSALASARRS
jgi:hypothetical protein